MKDIKSRFVFYENAQKNRMESILKEYDISYQDFLLIRALDFCDGHLLSEIRYNLELEVDTDTLMDAIQNPEYVTIQDGVITLNEEYKKLYKKIKKEQKKMDEHLIEEYGYDRYLNLLSELDAIIFMMS